MTHTSERNMTTNSTNNPFPSDVPAHLIRAFGSVTKARQYVLESQRMRQELAAMGIHSVADAEAYRDSVKVPSIWPMVILTIAGCAAMVLGALVIAGAR